MNLLIQISLPLCFSFCNWGELTRRYHMNAAGQYSHNTMNNNHTVTRESIFTFNKRVAASSKSLSTLEQFGLVNKFTLNFKWKYSHMPKLHYGRNGTLINLVQACPVCNSSLHYHFHITGVKCPSLET